MNEKKQRSSRTNCFDFFSTAHTENYSVWTRCFGVSAYAVRRWDATDFRLNHLALSRFCVLVAHIHSAKKKINNNKNKKPQKLLMTNCTHKWPGITSFSIHAISMPKQEIYSSLGIRISADNRDFFPLSPIFTHSFRCSRANIVVADSFVDSKCDNDTVSFLG